MPCLKCLGPDEARQVLRELHEGLCGSHQAAPTLNHKVLISGYYWPTIIRVATELIKTCRKCQEHANHILVPGEDMHLITTPWPFDAWGIDILGPFPTATGQRKFLIVAIDLFTIWIEAEPVKSINSAQIKTFVLQNILSQFGIPRRFVTDNSRQFISESFRTFCAQ